MTANPDPGPPVRCSRRPGSVWTHCRCPACLPGQLRLRRLYAGGGYRPPDRDRLRAAGEQALRDMLARPWSAEAIASACRIPFSTLTVILQALDSDTPVQLAPTTARRLLHPTGRPTAGYVPTLGPMRRARALLRIGWDPATIADRYPIQIATLRNVIAGLFDRVLAPSANAIDDAYRDLHTIPGPSWRAIARATKAGWGSPTDWAGLDMDAPTARLKHLPKHDAKAPTRKQAARLRKDRERHRVERRGQRAGLGRGERARGNTPEGQPTAPSRAKVCPVPLVGEDCK